MDFDIYVGKYQHEYSENRDDFLKTIGVNYFLRKLFTIWNPIVVVERSSDDCWIISFKLGPKTMELKFRPGEEAEMTTFLGTSTHMFTFEGTKIKEVQTTDTGIIEFIRDFTKEGVTMDVTHLATGAKYRSFFKRISPIESF